MKVFVSIRSTSISKDGGKLASLPRLPPASGLIFSHFIASTFDPFFASFEATMANIPYVTGYFASCWQSGTDVMIPKSTAPLRVDKLCTLLLFLDPEFNQNNNSLGRSLMAHAEAYS
jgi:hypothetical protein